jgi:hypothetical protein
MDYELLMTASQSKQPKRPDEQRASTSAVLAKALHRAVADLDARHRNAFCAMVEERFESFLDDCERRLDDKKKID